MVRLADMQKQAKELSEEDREVWCHICFTGCQVCRRGQMIMK